jgi:hypothetical protein
MITDEQAKATQEVAKTTGKFAEITEKVGGFLSKVIGPASNQFGGILEDWTRYYRLKNLLAIADKVEAIYAHRAIQDKTVPIRPRIAIPMLESAALEDDETLQTVWAKLIANSTDPNFKLALHPGYIEIIKQLSSDEALILESFIKLESYPILFVNHVSRTLAYTMNSLVHRMKSLEPNEASYTKTYELCQTHCKTLALKKPDDAQVYIDNLIRLRVIELGHDFLDEDRNAASVVGMRRSLGHDVEPASISIPARDEFLRMTAFGQNFVAACVVETVAK